MVNLLGNDRFCAHFAIYKPILAGFLWKGGLTFFDKSGDTHILLLGFILTETDMKMMQDRPEDLYATRADSVKKCGEAM